MIVVHQPGVFGFIVENIGGGEIVVIAFLALVVLGPDRIPEMARGAGRLINKVRSMSSDLTGDMADVINDPAMQPIRELGEFATRPRQKLAEYALEAEAEERQRQTDKTIAEAAGKGSTEDDPVIAGGADETEEDTAEKDTAEHDGAAG
jgi:sec-independent protein translocase protein TatB